MVITAINPTNITFPNNPIVDFKGYSSFPAFNMVFQKEKGCMPFPAHSLVSLRCLLEDVIPGHEDICKFG